MFEGITESLGNALSVFGRQGRLTEANIREGMRAVRTALLEADVAYDVAQTFVNRVTEQAVGEQVLKSLRPASRTRTLVPGSELSRFASADPAEPPPTIT